MLILKASVSEEDSILYLASIVVVESHIEQRSSMTTSRKEPLESMHVQFRAFFDEYVHYFLSEKLSKYLRACMCNLENLEHFRRICTSCRKNYRNMYLTFEIVENFDEVLILRTGSDCSKITNLVD